MHCRKGVVETENWLSTQRLASLSYNATGSPSLLAAQPLPREENNVLPAVGPETLAPVVLLKTANEEFTHCTYWVAPTAPLVSGGALLTGKPREGLPSPSTLTPEAVGAARVGASPAVVCWSTGSWKSGMFTPAGRGNRRARAASLATCAPDASPVGSWR